MRRVSIRNLAGLLLGIAGLAVAGRESVSFGHEHAEGGRVTYHRHFFLGEHDHSDDHDHDHDHGDHHPEAPPPHEHDCPKRATHTVLPVAPELFQPTAAHALAAPQAAPVACLSPRALPLLARPLPRPVRPRPPPPPFAVHDSLG